MNAESKINVHYSSLVGLRAELLRKQTEVEAAKAKLENAQPVKKPKTKDKISNEKRKKKKSEESEKTNQTEDIESMKALKKSKLMLQAKSRLYEKLSKTHTNMNPNFLVDFEHKPDYSDHSEEELQKEDSECKSDYESDSEWVEYTDCFGRTRKCLREDLPTMQEKDKFLRKKIIAKPHEEIKEKILYVEDRVPEKEPEIEMMRKKWDEQTAKLADKADIHYQDVLFDEARTHGVGYYAFSQDEEERTKQQENLLKLRKETEKRQRENQEIREMKEKMQQNRLRVARLRQRIRAGLPAEESEEEIAANNPIDSLKTENNENQEDMYNYKKVKENEKICETNDSVQNSKQLTAKQKLEDIENKVQAFGELLAKRNQWYVMSQDEWTQKKRKERVEEFAPVYENFQSGGSLDLSSITNEHSMNKDWTNSNDYVSHDSDIIGPIPPSEDKSSIIGPIPRPTDESSIIGPVSPLLPTMEAIVPQSSRDSTNNTNVNIADQIEAGLKYLRKQFDNENT